ncbi:MAG: hypothetical protein ABSA83_23380 [Verrucomicrobiota bacterium]|jgi:hypothetical protein
MDPITITTALALKSGAAANAHTFGPFTDGTMSDRFGSQPFSFKSTPFGLDLNSAGKAYSLRPDFISQTPFGKSWSLLENGSPVGSIGFNNVTNSIGAQGLSPKMGTALGAALRSRGVI